MSLPERIGLALFLLGIAAAFGLTAIMAWLEKLEAQANADEDPPTT